MKNPAPVLPVLLVAAFYLLSGHSLYAKTCQEKHDECVAACDQKRTPKEKAICVEKCDEQKKQCTDSTRPQPSLPTSKVDIVACLEGGPPCRGAVRKICTQMAGACDDCWKTLCGGNWSFSSSVPLEVKLLATANPAKKARVLATSSMKGKQAALRVPAAIKLSGKEELYFEFSSKEKRTGSVKVHIQRTK